MCKHTPYVHVSCTHRLSRTARKSCADKHKCLRLVSANAVAYAQVVGVESGERMVQNPLRFLTVALVFVKAARAFCCRVALDNFGSGLSSFVYLRTFTVDCIKIDGAFVGNVTQADSVDRVVVLAIVNVAHALGLTMVAEHVDSADVFATLAELGVDLIQGFLISQPKPLKNIFEKSAL